MEQLYLVLQFSLQEFYKNLRKYEKYFHKIYVFQHDKTHVLTCNNVKGPLLV